MTDLGRTGLRWIELDSIGLGRMELGAEVDGQGWQVVELGTVIAWLGRDFLEWWSLGISRR